MRSYSSEPPVRDACEGPYLAVSSENVSPDGPVLPLERPCDPTLDTENSGQTRSGVEKGSTSSPTSQPGQASPSLRAIPSRRRRILVIWNNQHIDMVLEPFFLRNTKYDFEIVCGGEQETPSPYQASRARLWKLRRRLEKGEFDLVISAPVVHEPWPRFKGPSTTFIKAVRTFATKRIRLLDTFWTPWLLSGKLRDRVPLAVLDIEDPPFIPSWDFPLLKACTLFFKINLYHLPLNSISPLATIFGHRRIFPYVTKLRPMSVGIDRQNIPEKVRPMRERDIDILCTGTIRRPPGRGLKTDPLDPYNRNVVRQDIYERCLKLGSRFHVHHVENLTSWDNYQDLLQRSKLVVCTESVGCETSRLYDTSAHAAVPLINWPYTQNYKMFQPDVHAIYFSLIGDDFERVVAEALRQPEKLERMGQAARAFTIEHKDRLFLGEYVIEETIRTFISKNELASA